jgi:hypothetical protein
MSPHTISPSIGQVVKGASVHGKGDGNAVKKFSPGIGFVDDLTAGLVEEWNRVVDGAMASLGNGFEKQPPSGVFRREAKTTIG